MTADILAEGKTKIIYQYRQPHLVRVENKPVVTWDDKYTQTMPGKDVWANTTTCRMFELMLEDGIPVAFEEYLSPTEFLAPRCAMVPVEIILRFANEPESSYGKRNPRASLGPFATPQVEFFLKTSGRTFNGISFDFDDPYIHRYDETGMWVHDPKVPVDEEKLIFVPFDAQFGDEPVETFERMRKLALDTGRLLKRMWNSLGWNLGDFKIECGYATGELLVADVIDNDSWRIQGPDGVERSKQTIRTRWKNEGASALADILREASLNYAMVAEAAERLTYR